MDDCNTFEIFINNERVYCRETAFSNPIKYSEFRIEYNSKVIAKGTLEG